MSPEPQAGSNHVAGGLLDLFAVEETHQVFQHLGLEIPKSFGKTPWSGSNADSMAVMAPVTDLGRSLPLVAACCMIQS